MIRFVKLMVIPFENVSRNKRELAVVKKLNAEIIVVARGNESRILPKEGHLIHELSTKPLGRASYLTPFNRLISIFIWAVYVRRLKPNFISCHGIVALGIGWLSTLFILKKRPRLIYDSHEFELGVSPLKPRGVFKTQLLRRAEKFLIHKSSYTIVVSDSIADELQKVHSLKKRPLVIRNIPYQMKIEADICEEKRQEILNEFNSYNEINNHIFISMYHGAVMQNRGIENLIKTVGITENIHLVILGFGTEDYINSLKLLCIQEKVQDRVMFLPAVPLEVLWQYIGAVDVGMITIPNSGQSHYYMLPNKLFENIQALTPIICSNFPEISKVIQSYAIGITVDPSDINQISEALVRMCENTGMYHIFKNNLIRAKAELCWENESKRLEKAYKRLFLK